MVEDLIPKNMRHPRTAPAWLKHDKHVLRFYGFFQESVVERPDENCRYRQVQFMYYMEDGTMQINEPKVENSGIMQGTLCKRQRVPRSDGMGFVGPDDFRNGEQVTIYGRMYQITGCDRFTRWFYEENGIDVGPDEPMVEDRWQKGYKFNTVVEKGGMPMSTSAFEAKTLTKFQIGQPPADKKEKQFLLNDRKVLRFQAFWDDHTLYGSRVYFAVHYYLSDNTVEINEAHARNSGRDAYPVFYKRGKLLKKNSVNAYPGMLSGASEFYLPEDFSIGESINVWGRQVMLFDCDDFTRKFYRGYMDFEQPVGQADVFERPPRHLKLHPPPHNGIGTEEDTLGNVNALQPKAPKQDMCKLMALSGEVLRFEAKMVNGEPEDENRVFLISYFPDTDRVGVNETQSRNSGHMAGKFREKARIKNPATGKWFALADFYVGATVSIVAQPFRIVRADEHALQHMENQPDLYPFADPAVVARRLAPLAGCAELQQQDGIDPDSLKELAASAGVYLVDHEVITLLRTFGMETEEGGAIISCSSLLRAMQA